MRKEREELDLRLRGDERKRSPPLVPAKATRRREPRLKSVKI
jgi:hypothetical protein